MLEQANSKVIQQTAVSPAVSGALCRHCGTRLRHTFVDLGMSPLCESFLSADQLNSMEPFYPLHVYVCSECFLVQLEEYVDPASIFSGLCVLLVVCGELAGARARVHATRWSNDGV